jgi:hypothetical protein
MRDFRLPSSCMRSTLFWVVTQRGVVVLYRHFGTKFRSHLQETNRLFRNVITILPLYKVKVKKKCTLVQAVRPIGGVEAEFYPFLTTALEEGEGSASRPGRSLPPGNSRYPFYRRLGLDRRGKSRPHLDSIPGPSSP